MRVRLFQLQWRNIVRDHAFSVPVGIISTTEEKAGLLIAQGVALNHVRRVPLFCFHFPGSSSNAASMHRIAPGIGSLLCGRV